MQSTHAPQCTVEGCEKPLLQRDLCSAHYMKLWRYGDPLHRPNRLKTDLTGQRFGTLVADSFIERPRALGGSYWECTCDCGEKTTARTHNLTAGAKVTCGNRTTHHRSEDAGNKAAHDRVRRDRGPSTDHRCIDCGGPASHWSYDHDDPNEMQDPVRGPYSLDATHYDPRCVPCYKAFDLRAAAA